MAEALVTLGRRHQLVLVDWNSGCVQPLDDAERLMPYLRGEA